MATSKKLSEPTGCRHVTQRQILLADLVITLDEPAVLRSGAVAMGGGRIAAVGPASEVLARFGHLDRLDGGAAALLL
ncbi:hypothetical protein O7599_05535 [Streptomyces sp. WMMC500]|uniref:imidazolonepropionase-like domain-containing protein n=1 Tax=Streptomyces sp. WMMC500 TaxID=3015154 RepID=UPI00248B4D7B|nr:hypothetical protein [Streptomyces sp. WMMC500]WBB62003.1 hypothetical protein O7599_05535 [Streptomyces sp. WMMC500]